MASPQPQGLRVLLFGHDPNVVHERCETLHSRGYETRVVVTAQEAAESLSGGWPDVLLVGSQIGPLTRLRLVDEARHHGLPVVHIAYHNHPTPSANEVYVTRPCGASELLRAFDHILDQRPDRVRSDETR